MSWKNESNDDSFILRGAVKLLNAHDESADDQSFISNWRVMMGMFVLITHDWVG